MGVFGSIQVGSGERFASSQGGSTNPFAPDVSTAQLESPPAPGEYDGLRSGPDFVTEFEANETPAVDGSKDLLRSLSPFLIQVEPPLVYSGVDENAKADYGALISAGHRAAPAAFMSARNRIKQDMPGGPQLSNSGSVESYVAQGYQASATSASRTTQKLGTSGPSRIGSPALADVYTAVDVTMQLRALLETPPLILLINPQSLNINYAKIQQYSDRTRSGFVFQGWGEEQPSMSISARCGAFISGGRGVQWASRRDSAAWQNLANAFRFYRHNGYIYDTVGKSNAHHFVGALSIHYDGWVYYGNMESFNYSYDEASQLGGVTFEMEFKINAMVDTSQVPTVVTPMSSPIPSKSDPRYGGQANSAVASEGDLTISTRDGVQVGADNFQTVSGVEPGDGLQQAPVGSGRGTSTLPGSTAPSSGVGFASTPEPEAQDDDLFAPPLRVSPFRVGG